MIYKTKWRSARRRRCQQTAHNNCWPTANLWPIKCIHTRSLVVRFISMKTLPVIQSIQFAIHTMYELTGTSIVTGNNKLNAWHHSVCSLWRHIVLKLYSVSRVRNKWQLSNQKGFLSWIRWYLGVSIKCSSIVMYGYINVHVHCTIITHWSYNSYMMHAVHSRSFTHSKLNVHFMQDFWR